MGPVVAILLWVACAGTLDAAPNAPVNPRVDLPFLQTSPYPIPNGGLTAGNRIPEAFSIPGIKHFKRVDVDPVGMLKRVEGLESGFLPLDLGFGLHWDLELERISIRAPGYRVRLLTANGLVDMAPGQERSYRGRIRGNPGSKVRLSFADGRITGFIDAGNGDRTFVEPLAMIDSRMSREAHAVYKQADMKMPVAAACGWAPTGVAPDPVRLPVPGMNAIPVPPLGKYSGLPASAQTVTGAEPCALVEIGVAAEYSMVKGWGTPAAVEKRINDIFSMVEGLYEDPRIDIHIKLTEMIIESGPNLTWGPMNINTYLTNLSVWARGAGGFKNAYDVADLWYFDPLVATSTTGLANVGTVCNKTSGGHVIRDFTRTASFLMINQAHELGHSFGANHVDNPKALLNPMILGDNTAWDDTTIAAILNHKHSRTCLSSCNQGPTAEFLVTAKSPCSDTRQFADASKGAPVSWAWNFGDGQTSNLQNPSHTYAAAGVFTAQLTATNEVGSNAVSKAGILVKPFKAPAVTGARSCKPGPLALKASVAAGTLKWYDLAQGGNKVGEGTSFLTPALAESRIYFVEAGDPDYPVEKLGPAGNTIGAGQYFVANPDRRLYFDVHRPMLLKTAKVYATGAGPRTIEILDQGDVRVASRTVQVPAGESRVALNIDLEPGDDYAIKYSGSPDSLNLFRNSAGATFPYRSKDSLATITHSDATPSDSTAQSGYYYFFYDWEIQERACGSVRVPVAAEISCVPVASSGRTGPAVLSAKGAGRYRLAGIAKSAQDVEFRILYLDGREARRKVEAVAAGPFAVDLDLVGLPANLYFVEVRLGGSRTLEMRVGF